MIRIELDAIPEGFSHIDLLEEASEVGFGEDIGIVSLDSPVSLALDAMRSTAEIVLRGRAGVDVTLDCGRCLKQYGTRLEAGLNILCVFGQVAPDGVDGCREGVIEISANSRFIDISGEVRSELMLVLPVKPLCSDDCKGLCPVCGANLNETTCSCERDEHDSRWDALKNLK
ncbi:MAG: DUF177 domain-containing protein [bacterium]